MWVLKKLTESKVWNKKTNLKQKIPAHARVQNPINTEIIAQLKAPQMFKLNWLIV